MMWLEPVKQNHRSQEQHLSHGSWKALELCAARQQHRERENVREDHFTGFVQTFCGVGKSVSGVQWQETSSVTVF